MKKNNEVSTLSVNPKGENNTFLRHVVLRAHPEPVSCVTSAALTHMRAPAAPTGKSFRFVRACERAGARAARDQLRLPRGFCGVVVFFVVVLLAGRCFFQTIDSRCSFAQK